MELLIAACLTVVLSLIGMFIGGSLAMRGGHYCTRESCTSKHKKDDAPRKILA